jgi:hypothetical protein
MTTPGLASLPDPTLPAGLSNLDRFHRCTSELRRLAAHRRRHRVRTTPSCITEPTNAMKITPPSLVSGARQPAEANSQPPMKAPAMPTATSARMP